jgi:hypothetical protein
MPTCKYCNKLFLETKPWQEFCCTRHQQDWHLHQRKLARQEKLFDKLARRDHGEGTPEQRQKAREVVARIVRTFSVEPKLRRRI